MKKALTEQQSENLLNTLKKRFEDNMNRHNGIKWNDVEAKLKANTSKLWSLQQMEETGGEPDVVEFDTASGNYIFFDCSAESPSGRRSYCYDRAAMDARKQNKPSNNAMEAAAAMGIILLTEAQYAQLQQLGAFDTKTSSWLLTPDAIRKYGGAIFGDRRYNHVFTYHNGADSYYAARGFRGCLSV
ncbi:DUF4256 domain-containing protein [Flavobacterium sp. D11R37]|uniref:DUF4256 domain-containing protein n=1 Tax=Flavobacterium coralii TaxID=2838017 RepID=UPI001CA774E2|nr:DUF4256 domain-containing protein [Flavobacterium coralii]MBY8963513.1 DUF4256 domain-containing protein [Flavobacterium coralii]